MESSDHLDVLIVGAGISGIDAGYHLQTRCPGKLYAILEARGAIGGTWDLFRYPGIRSDSDMYTLGFPFRPWTDPRAIADGTTIRRYVEDTAREFGIDRRIRFHRRVTAASWSSDDATWTVELEHTDSGDRSTTTCSFLMLCSGYYRYDEGYSPEFPGADRFAGRIVHPQHWPDDLDYTGKRVIVIGSGATAVTIVPAMARDAEHVTMLQRTPSYILSLPERDPVARLLAPLPVRAKFRALRVKSLMTVPLSFFFARHWPDGVRRAIRRANIRALPEGYDVDTHFNPPYDVWRQRLCFVPDHDLFDALSSGSASIVTDRIATFTETGVELESGGQLDADVVVSATGLNIVPLGGVQLTVDGTPISVAETVSYKGMMLSGVPNLSFAIGYTNASWTLKCDLTAKYACRLINHLDETGLRQCTPLIHDPSIGRLPFIDFTSGYVKRGIGAFPKQGERPPWRLYQSYPRDLLSLRYSRLADEALEFSNPRPAGRAGERVAA